MHFIGFLVHSNIFISLAAVALAIETEIELGLVPVFRPYMLIIFFATLFEYNLHRLITVVQYPAALESEKHAWVKENKSTFYLLLVISFIGSIGSALYLNKNLFFALIPLGAITLLYSIPMLKIKRIFFRLREIPFIKIFLIALVWSAVTVLLPVFQTPQYLNVPEISLIFFERFFFVFAIAIPFDIRDMKTDHESGLKTIPLLLGQKKAIYVALFCLFVFLTICIVHYSGRENFFLLAALCLSALSTYYFIVRDRIKQKPYYHNFVLDGTLLLQAALVILFTAFGR